MNHRILIGGASRSLGERIAVALNEEPLKHATDVFPDGEMHVRIQEDVQDADIFIIQSTGPPVADNLFELLMLADACRRAGAQRLSAVVPYLGYARQDRRMQQGEAVGARIVTDLIGARFDRIMTVDLHNPSIEGFFSIRIDPLTAVPQMAEALGAGLPRDTVIVAPDSGAAKLANVYARLLDFPTALISKVRLGGDEVRVLDVSGNVQNRTPLIVDDMISTGGTIVAAIEALLERGAVGRIHVAAIHGLFVGDALQRFAGFPVERLVVSDSIETAAGKDFGPLEVVSLKDILADRIRRMSM